MYNKFEQNKAFSIVKKALNYLTPKYLAVCILLSLTFATVQSVYSAVGIRETINFQGKLVNSAGLNVADGSYSVVFSLYTVSSGGTYIWQETQNVSTVDGLFRVELGSVSSLSSVNFNDDSLYLGIKVGADAEMTPRVRYTATPYAFQAKNVSWSGLQSPNANTSLSMAAYTTSLLYSGTSGSNDLFVLSSSANSTGTGRLMSLRTATDSEISPFHVSAKGIEALFVSNLGRVGIGTTSPQKNLDIQGNARTSLSFVVGEETESGIQSLYFQRGGGSFGEASISGGVYFIPGDGWYQGSGNGGTSIQFSPGGLNFLTAQPGTPGDPATLTQRMVIKQSGNVGIGTDNPSARLQVAGAITASGIISGTGSGLTNLNASNISSGTIPIASVVGAYGNITGVGTLTSLNVSGSITQDGSLSSITGTTFRSSLGSLGTPSYSFTGDINTGIFSPGADILGFVTSGTERMRIASNGNIGIGTTSPGAGLHIVTNVSTALQSILEDSRTYDSIPVGITTYIGKYDSIGNRTSFVNVRGGKENAIDSDTGGLFTVETRTSGGTLNEKFRINNAGNVGIGTTNPSEQLEVSQSILIKGGLASGIKIDGSLIQRQTAGNALRFGVADAEVMRIQNGNVGIGTTSPNHKLVVEDNLNGANVFRIRNLNSGSTASSILRIGNNTLENMFDASAWSSGFTETPIRKPNGVSLVANGGGGLTLSASDANGTIRLFTGGENATNQRMTILSNGNVGIGTTSPTSILSVTDGVTPYAASTGVVIDTRRAVINGTDNARVGLRLSNNSNAFSIFYGGTSDRLRFMDGANNEVMSLLNAGNVGIGTTSPSYKTEVAGATTSYWNGSTFTNTPMAMAISNTQPGGYDPVLMLQQTDSGGTTKNAGGIGLVGTSNWATGILANQISDMYFFVRNNSGALSERMRITSSGNVGIGTVSPTLGRLQVSGSITMTDDQSSFLNLPRFSAGDPRSYIVAGDSDRDYPVGMELRVRGSNGSPMTVMNFDGTTGNGNISYGLNIATVSGNVGIGTASPNTYGKLAVSVSGTGSKAGIGISNGGYNGTILSPTEIGLLEMFSSVGTFPAGIYGLNTYNNDSASWLAFKVTNGAATTTTAMTIASTGNVGIGTVSPSSQLDIFGTTAGLQLSYDANDYGRFTVASDGALTLSGVSGGGALTNIARYSTSQINMDVPTSFNSAGDVSMAYDLYLSNQTASAIKSDGPLTIQSGEAFENLNLTLKASGQGNLIVQSKNIWADGTNVGIGTTNPGNTLTIGQNTASNNTDYSLSVLRHGTLAAPGTYTANTPAIAVIDISGDGPATAETQALLNVNAARIADTDTYAANAMLFNVQNDTGSAFTIKGNRNVGIGTASPGARLQVVGPPTSSGITLNVGGGGDTVLASGGSLFFDGNYSYATGNYIRPIAANTQTFVTSGTERMRITSNGNVGIGTVNPDNFNGLTFATPILDVNGTIQIRGLAANNLAALNIGGDTFRKAALFTSIGTSDPYLSIGVAASGNSSSTTERLRILSNGNVGIGTTSPQNNLDVRGSVNNFSASLARDINLNEWTGLHFGYSEAANNLYRKSAIVFERKDGSARGSIHILNDSVADAGSANLADSKLTIDLNGNVGIGTTSPSQALHVTGRIRMDTWTADGDAVAYRDAATNSIALITSDIRLKKDIIPIRSGLEVINQIGAYMYHELDENITDKYRLGVMAQELMPLMPELVYSFSRTGTSETFYSVHYDKLAVLLLKGIQEQQLQIEAQSSALQALDPKILDLENTLAQIELERATAVSQEEGGTAFENLYSIVEDTVSRVVSLENSVAEILSRIDSLVAPQISASDSARIEDLSQRMSFVEAMFMGELSTGLNSTASAQLAMSISENEIIFDRKVVAEGDLSVLGETNLGDVGVTGNITNNMLVINGFDESLATPGASLNTLAGALNIQSSGLNSINFVDGSFKMDTDGNFIIHKGNLEVSMGSVKGNDGIRGINVSVGQSQVEMRVNFKAKNDTENYAVGISPSWFTNFLVSGKDENGFTVKFSTPAPQGAKFDWIVIE